MKKHTKKNVKSFNQKALAAGGAAAVSLLMAVPAFAATTPTTSNSTTPSAHYEHSHKFPGIRGTVTAINGTTLTVTAKDGTTYTVYASNATVKKGTPTSTTSVSVTSIAVNDHVSVRGTVNGTSVTAQTIVDGVAQNVQHRQLTNAAFGTVASVSGSSFTLTHKTQTGISTVTISTTSATTFKKNGQPDTLTDLTVGQRVVVMGAKDSSGNIADATSVNIMVRKASLN